MALTEQIIEIAALPSMRLSQRALLLARFSLLDWMACGIAAINEPVSRKLHKLAEDEGGNPASSLFGGGKAPSRMAALVNGTTSHALDYDDTHFAHVGHLSVGIYPAALAVAEETGATASQLLEAFLVGAESAIRIGMVLGRSHYNHGFHQTATAGAFGATVASGRLYGLNADQMRNALGLCATRASGLKSQFGTMGKPYNAGLAAANGVECARLAQLGMTSADDGIMGIQGFVQTHHPDTEGMQGLAQKGVFLFEDNKYKLHACCHGLHAMIEALLDNEELVGVGLEEIASFELTTNPRWLTVCDIKQPRTGLEVKFSYNWLAAMTLRGDKTGDDRIYTDAIASDPAISAFARRVSVTGDDGLTDLEVRAVLRMVDGSKVEIYHDLAAWVEPNVLAKKLRSKAEAVIGERGAQLWDQFARLDLTKADEIGKALSR